MLIYSLGHVFVVSELFVLWVRMLPWRGHCHHRFHSHSCSYIWPLPLLSLLCYSLLELSYIVRMRAKAHHSICFLLLISTIFSPVRSSRSKNLKNCFNPLSYAYIFIYRQQMHWLLYQNSVTKTSKWGSRDMLQTVLRTAPWELYFPLWNTLC